MRILAGSCYPHVSLSCCCQGQGAGEVPAGGEERREAEGPSKSEVGDLSQEDPNQQDVFQTDENLGPWELRMCISREDFITTRTDKYTLRALGTAKRSREELLWNFPARVHKLDKQKIKQ